MKRRKFIGLSAVAVSVSTVLGEKSGKDEKALLSFGLITDVQYADADPEGERHYRESIPKLREAVAWLAGKTLPFTLHLGDFIDRDFTAFGKVLPLLEKLGHPVWHGLGNHDYGVRDGEKCRVVSMLDMPHDYFGFSHSGVRFLMLDTNDVSVYKYPADNPLTAAAKSEMAGMEAKGSNACKPWNGGVSADQLEWLDRELTSAGLAQERVILCGHHPLLPEDGDQAWNNQQVITLIDRHTCVAAYFNGHHHDGGQVIRNGVPYITFKSILQRPGVNSYSAIHLFPDRLEIEGNGREVPRVIPLNRG